MGKFMGKDVPFEVNLAPLDNSKGGGQWVTFPTSAELLRDVFQDLEIGPQGWQIVNAECYVQRISDLVQSSQNLDELNYLALKLEQLSEEDIDQFVAVLETDAHCDSVAELINLCDNLDCYTFYENICDHEDLGRHWMFHMMGLDTRTLNEIDDYIDFEGFGRGTSENLGGEFAENCYIVPSEESFVPYYSGKYKDIPEEYRVTTEIIVPEFTADEWFSRTHELAESLDNFFREFDFGYAERYPNVAVRKNEIAESLFDGKIAAFDKLLDDMGQTQWDVLPMEIAEYKAGTRYDPAKDVETEKMKVLVVEPRKVPYIMEIESDAAIIERELGATCEQNIRTDDPIAVLVNPEAKEKGMELNRSLYGSDGKPYEVIAGTFLVVGLDKDGSFASLSDDMIQKYSQRFQTIEVYAQVGGKTYMFQIPQDAPIDVDAPFVNSRPSVRVRLAASHKACREQSTNPHIPKNKEQAL